MKKKILAFTLTLCAVILAVVWIARVIQHKRNAASEKQTTTEEMQQTDGYTYGEVEKAVDYLADSDDTSKELARLIDPLFKSRPITALYVRNVCNIIEASEEVYTGVLAGMQDDDYVSKEQFDIIYHGIAESGLVTGLQRQDVYVYDCYTDTDGGTERTVIFDGQREYMLDTELSDTDIDSILDVYTKDDKIFKINGQGSSEVILTNALMLSAEENSGTFLYKGREKTYDISKAAVDIQEPCIVKLVIDNEGISDIYCQDIRNVRVERVKDSGLCLADGTILPYTDDFCIYDVYDKPVCEKSMQLLKGYRNITVAVEDGRAIGALIDEPLVSDSIRVILSNDAYTSYDMKRAEIEGDTRFSVVYPDDTERYCEAGDAVTVNAGDFEAGDIITFVPEEASGHLQVNTLTRSYGIPVYSGRLEIRICENKTLHIINELPLEQYLYSVVASELPSASHEEALKAMAICARGYAYTRIEDESFADYHADLDDSSLCQVYNNVRETEQSIQAVKDTYGMVPVYDGTVIVPLYFSTSCGTTCTNEEIWGGNAQPYLQSNVETLIKQSIDLSDEERFQAFMADSMGYDVIDKDMPYYRWRVDYTGEEMSEAINSMLEERISMSADNIKVKQEDGSYAAEEIDDIGLVESITITARTKSGVVSEMEIEGTNGTIQVTGQTNIRNLITPINHEIVRQDGSMVVGWTSLPSPFYYIEKTEQGFSVHGGGFGHGVGMSQNGANILAEAGYNYEYILRHYYSYVNFMFIYTIEDEEETGE